MRPRASVYVDGFNLYYRRLRDYPEAKWLDLRKLCSLLLPTADVTSIHYFTARIDARHDDLRQPDRQDDYIRALEATGVEPHFGTFRTDPTLLPLASNPQAFVEVVRTVEKGSDVNLATRLLVDAHAGVADQYWVVSRDSDLKAPIEEVRKLGCFVGLLGPAKRASKDLLPLVSSYKPIRLGPLLASQLPNELKTLDGETVRRLPEWASGFDASQQRVPVTISLTVSASPDDQESVTT